MPRPGGSHIRSAALHCSGPLHQLTCSLAILRVRSCSCDSRTLCGTGVLAWDSPELVSLLCSVLHKMAASPVAPVQLVDRDRPYIVLDADEWTWTTLELPKGVRAERFLDYTRMPTRAAGRFLLLRDLHGGADGRVWMVCTTSGLVGVIKFGQPRDGEDREQRRQRLEKEAEVWRQVWQLHEVRVVTLAHEPALLMPYVEPVESMEDGRRPSEAAVRAAAAHMANAGYCHLDLDWRHVGVLAAPVAKRAKRATARVEEARVIFFDLGRVREPAAHHLAGVTASDSALTEMLSCLQLSS